MAIERKCENCVYYEPNCDVLGEKCSNCKNEWQFGTDKFMPTEEAIRKDERAKLRDKIVSKYSSYNFMYSKNIEDEEIRKIYEPISSVLFELIEFLNDLDFGMEQ